MTQVEAEEGEGFGGLARNLPRKILARSKFLATLREVPAGDRFPFVVISGLALLVFLCGLSVFLFGLMFLIFVWDHLRHLRDDVSSSSPMD
jgi:hypothetical protein